MKLFIRDMTAERLKEVFDANEKIRREMYDCNFESEMNYATEIIDCFDHSAIDYCIGYDRGTYFRWRDERKFIEGCINMQNNYYFLPTEDGADIENAAKLIAVVDELEAIDISESIFEELEAEIATRCDAIADNIDSRMTDIFKYALFDEEYALEAWLEFGHDMYGDCYIIEEENNFALYRDRVEVFN